MKKDPKPKVTVFAAGCFNRVHAGHLAMLRTARLLGDRLVVVLANDAHNRKPAAVDSRRRTAWIESLGIADKVVVGGAEGFAGTLRRERPDIVVLGYDQRLPDEETARAAREGGVEIRRLPWFSGRGVILRGKAP